MDMQERIYHEVILNHQRKSWVYDPDCQCMCGWKITLGFDTHAQHLAGVLTAWLELNFNFHARI